MMKKYRAWIPVAEKNHTVISDFTSPSDEMAIEFSRRLAKQQKGFGFRLQKKFWWFIYYNIKIEVFENE